jgi:BCD family chlorophyll transporter-like MFS transporter
MVQAQALFVAGVLMVGLGGGLFGHGTLTATMNFAPKDQVGLSLGTWGAVQASAAGLAVALGALIRDVGTNWAPDLGMAAGYHAVYALECLLLVVTLVAMLPLLRDRRLDRNGTGPKALLRSKSVGPAL